MIGKTNATVIIGETQPEQTTGDYLVRYFDIDGTLIKQQWVNSGQSATPPANHSFDNTRLTFDRWNQASTNVLANRDIGAIYSTMGGKTYAKFRLTSSLKTITLYLIKSNTAVLTIDWGDGTQNTYSNSGTFNTGAHVYATGGTYWVTMWISSGTGTYFFGNGTTSTPLLGSSQSSRDTLYSIYLGSNINRGLYNYPFYMHKSLCVVSIPHGLSSLGSYSFQYCTGLPNINLGSSMVGTDASMFEGCTALALITHNYINSLSGYSLRGCSALLYYNMGQSVTSIGSYAISNNPVILKIVVPSTTTTISANAFNNNTNVHTYILHRTTPPYLENVNAFTGIKATCKIYVPDASVTAYKTSTNWSAYANYIYPLSDIGE